MGLSKTVLFFGFFLIINFVQCTEFVPVYMWSSKRSSEKIPVLRKISQDSFKDDMMEQLKYYDFIVAFAEQTLSPEDFAQHDEAGGKVFSHLAKLKKSSKVSYLPYVQNPMKALKHIDASVSEIFINNINDKFDIPKTDILIVNLNDAEDSENRLSMLKRHDEFIASVYKKIERKNENVLTLYTAYHESWVTSEDVTNSRRARSLLASETAVDVEGIFHNDSNILLYYTSVVYQEKPSKVQNVTFDISSTRSVNETTVKLVSINPQLEVNVIFANTSSEGYWVLYEIQANLTKSEQTKMSSGAEIYAPFGFSYHCGDQLFSSQNFSLMIKDFQIQVYENSPPVSNKFDDAYDCVGFTTVPIWSGLFVTAILLLILTFGITMMMDIRTMDRFDDPKGKTITINAE